MTDPQMSKKEVRAKAAADKAYAKSQRSWFPRHKILSVFGVFILLGIIAGVSSSGGGGNAITGQQSTVVSTSASPATDGGKATAPTNASVGQALHVTGNDGLDASVTLLSVTHAAKGPGDAAMPAKNGVYVAAKFAISDVAGKYDFNLLYLKFQVADGTTYTGLDGNAAFAGFEPSLSAGSLNPGQKTGGFVAFDVPSAHGTIQLTDPLGGVVGQWTV